jgi:CheY-like chemotaxis protein
VAVVLLTDDLMVVSRVEGSAQRVGVGVATVGDAAGVVARCTADRVDLVIIDLSARSGDAGGVIEQFRSAGVERPPIVAFGPHVHEGLLAAAAEAGCDQVLSRGQFFAQSEAILQRQVDPTEAPAD